MCRSVTSLAAETNVLAGLLDSGSETFVVGSEEGRVLLRLFDLAVEDIAQLLLSLGQSLSHRGELGAMESIHFHPVTILPDQTIQMGGGGGGVSPIVSQDDEERTEIDGRRSRRPIDDGQTLFDDQLFV